MCACAHVFTHTHACMHTPVTFAGGVLLYCTWYSRALCFRAYADKEELSCIYPNPFMQLSILVEEVWWDVDGEVVWISKTRSNSELKARAESVKHTVVILLRNLLTFAHRLFPSSTCLGCALHERYSSTDYTCHWFLCPGSLALGTGVSCPHFTNKKLKKHRVPNDSSKATQLLSPIKKITLLEGRNFN